jgi:hypothetical protein
MESMLCNVEFEYQLSICSGTKENLDRVGRSQDHSESNWRLASSPALNPEALTLICAVVFFFCFFFFFFSFLTIFSLLLLFAYDLDKHQAVYNTCGRKKRIYEQICIQIYIYLYMWFFDYR